MWEEKKKIKKTAPAVTKKAVPVKKTVVKKAVKSLTKKEVIIEMDAAYHKLREAKKKGDKEEIKKWNKIHNYLANQAATM